VCLFEQNDIFVAGERAFMDIPVWSFRSDADSEHAKFERLRFRQEFIAKLCRSAGHSIVKRSAIDDPDSMEFRQIKENFYSHSGVLFVSNKKRMAESYSLILNGKCVACSYTFQAEELDEELTIRWKAVQRDLEHELSTLSFFKMEDGIIQGAAAFFNASNMAHATAPELRAGAEAMIAEHIHAGMSATIVATNPTGSYFVFFADGKLVGTMANIWGGGKRLIGFASDLSYLNLKSEFGEDETYLESFSIANELFEQAGIG
jgi:hypothetical protein